jgi:hypothetical protein
VAPGAFCALWLHATSKNCCIGVISVSCSQSGAVYFFITRTVECVFPVPPVPPVPPAANTHTRTMARGRTEIGQSLIPHAHAAQVRQRVPSTCALACTAARSHAGGAAHVVGSGNKREDGLRGCFSRSLPTLGVQQPQHLGVLRVGSCAHAREHGAFLMP